MTISKTIQEIYHAVLINNSPIKNDKFHIIEYNHPNTFWEKLKIFKSKIRMIHILFPTGRRMGNIEPNCTKAQLQAFSNNYIPKCKFLMCGRNIEYGYKYCNEHRVVCCVCHEKELIIRVDGKPYCGKCTIL